MLKGSITGIGWIEIRARHPLVDNADAKRKDLFAIRLHQPCRFSALLYGKWRIGLRTRGNCGDPNHRREKRELANQFSSVLIARSRRGNEVKPYFKAKTVSLVFRM